MSRIALCAMLSTAVIAVALTLPSPGQAATNAGASLAIEKPPEGSVQSGFVSIAQPFLSDQSFATSVDNWLELLFLDGTSVAMGPEAAFDVQSYEYDAANGNVALKAAIGRGTVRVVSGRYAAQLLQLSIGGAVASITSGAALIEVGDDGTVTVSLLWGGPLTATGGGDTETIVRPGFALAITDGVPGSPFRLSRAELEAKMASMSPPPGSAVTAWTGVSEASFTEPAVTDEDDGGEIAAKPRDDVIQQQAQITSTPPPPPPPPTPNFSLNIGQGLGQSGGSPSGLPNNTGSGVNPNFNTDPDALGSVRLIQVPNDRTLTDNAATNYSDLRGAGSVNGINNGEIYDVSLTQYYSNGLLYHSTETIIQYDVNETTGKLEDTTSHNVFFPNLTVTFNPQVGFEITDEDGHVLNVPDQTDFFGLDEDNNLAAYQFNANGTGPPQVIAVFRNANNQTYNCDPTQCGTGQIASLKDNPIVTHFGLTANENPADLTGVLFQTDSVNGRLDSNGMGVYFGGPADDSSWLPGQDHWDGYQLYVAANYCRTNCDQVVEWYESRIIVNSDPHPTVEDVRFFGNVDGWTVEPFRYVFYEAIGPSDSRIFGFGGPAIGAPGSVYTNGTELPGAAEDQIAITRYQMSDGLHGLDGLENDLGGVGSQRPLWEYDALPADSAFRREATFAVDAERGDTDLLVVTRDLASQDADNSNSFLRADLQITADGQSSASVSVGNIETLTGNTNGPVMAGRMVGSTRIDVIDPNTGETTVKGQQTASIHLTSALGSLGTGDDLNDPHFFGGNWALPEEDVDHDFHLDVADVDLDGDGVLDDDEDLDGDGRMDVDEDTNDNGALDGRIGFFVVGPVDNTNGEPTEAGQASGQEIAVNPADAINYNFARLAIGQEETVLKDGALAARNGAAPTVGYASGMVEHFTFEAGAPVTLALFGVGTSPGDNGPNVFFNEAGGFHTSADDNLIQAHFDLSAHPYGATLPAAGSIEFDVGSTYSAYVDANHYGGITSSEIDGIDVGFVVAPDELINGIDDGFQYKVDIKDYQHVKWGYWFGDILVGQTVREHVNLGYLVAGQRTDPSTIKDASTTLTYAGHIAATIYSESDGQGTIHEEIGNFTNVWNFTQMEGDVSANLDDYAYSGSVAGAPNSSDFGGTLDGSNPITNANAAMTMQGSFFGPVTPTTGGAAVPSEMGGTVSIVNDGGAAYRGEGIFAGQAQVPPPAP